jgi:hypothetical protein
VFWVTSKDTYFNYVALCTSHVLLQVGHEAFEQAAAGGAPGGGAGFGGFEETIFGDAFGGGMDEVTFFAAAWILLFFMKFLFWPKFKASGCVVGKIM